MQDAIIIFVRNPELGKVKTRLARDTGDLVALEVYRELLQHTHDNVVNVACDKFVYYAGHINADDLWENQLYKKKLQRGEDLGERMRQAFEEIFQLGYLKVLIMGSDCPDLAGSVIRDAFDRLDRAEVVIGPSTDGGYYLLGLTQPVPELFNNKRWSTDTVLADTVLDTVSLGRSCSLLRELADIDTAADLHRYREMQKG